MSRIDYNGFRSRVPSYVPKWRNWQTRWTQTPVGVTPRAGSIPAFGTIFHPGTAPQRLLPHNTCSSETTRNHEVRSE